MDRVILGNTGSGYGLRVSKPGYDVDTAAVGDLLFDATSSGILRKRASYSITVPAGTDQSVTITHGLGVVPIVVWPGHSLSTWVLRVNTSTLFVARKGNSASAFTIYAHLFTQIGS
jgi:hypothetical protein